MSCFDNESSVQAPVKPAHLNPTALDHDALLVLWCLIYTLEEPFGVNI